MTLQAYRRAALAVVTGFASLAVMAAAHQEIGDICGSCRVEVYAECGGFLEGASFDRSGRLWAVSLRTGEILSIDDSSRKCVVEGNTGGEPNGAKFHRDGRLFIADKDRGILAFDPSDHSVEVVADHYNAEKLRGTNDLVFDRNGGLYFTEPYGSSSIDPDGRVFYLAPGPNASPALLVDGVAFPNGIALTPGGGNVLVGEFAKRRILSLPSASSTNAFDIPYVAINTEGGIGPDGFAFDVAGNLYAAIFQGSEVAVYDADHFYVGSIRMPDDAGNEVTNLAFKDDWLYITEASKGIVYRIRVASKGLPLFNQL